VPTLIDCLMKCGIEESGLRIERLWPLSASSFLDPQS
jgi:hypothetical protein